MADPLAYGTTADSVERVVVDGLARLPQFCHATIADGWIHVSGTLGTVGDGFDLAEGGMGPQTAQTLRNIDTILGACGASFGDLVKVSVFVSDMDRFAEMNDAYGRFFVDVIPPARITVGKVGLALGALVEIEAIAYRSTAA